MIDLKKETQFFNRGRVLKIIGFFLFGIGVFTLLGWFGSKRGGIKIDWSLLLPLGGFIGAFIPFVQGVTSWIEGKLKVADERLDKLEVIVHSHAERINQSVKDRAELRKIILRIEARVDSYREIQKDTHLLPQIREIVELNRQLLKKLEEK